MRVVARAIALIGGVTLLLTWFVGSVAYADGNSGASGVALAIGSWPVVLAGLCGVGSTQLTAILTHRNAPQWFKSAVNLALTTLAGVLITITVVPGRTWEDYVAEIAVGEIIALGTHYAGGTALADAAVPSGMGATLPPLIAADPDTRGLIKPKVHRAVAHPAKRRTRA